MPITNLEISFRNNEPNIIISTVMNLLNKHKYYLEAQDFYHEARKCGDNITELSKIVEKCVTITK